MQCKSVRLCAIFCRQTVSLPHSKNNPPQPRLWRIYVFVHVCSMRLPGHHHVLWGHAGLHLANGIDGGRDDAFDGFVAVERIVCARNDVRVGKDIFEQVCFGGAGSGANEVFIFFDIEPCGADLTAVQTSEECLVGNECPA